MREGESGGLHLYGTAFHLVGQQVNVDTAVVVDAIAALLRPSEFTLYVLRFIKKGVWSKTSLEGCDRIQETMVGDESLGFGLYDGRAGCQAADALLKECDGTTDVVCPITEITAKADVDECHEGLFSQ